MTTGSNTYYFLFVLWICFTMSVWKNRALFTQKARCRLLWYLINKMCCHAFSTVNNEAICYDWNLKHWSLWYFQGIWCSHRPHLHSQHVHSLGCPSPLWVCHICQDITRTGGGKTLSEVRHSSLCFILCYYYYFFLLCAWIKNQQWIYSLTLFAHCIILVPERINSMTRSSMKCEMHCIDPVHSNWFHGFVQLIFLSFIVPFCILDTNNSKVILQRWIMGKMLICRGISILLAL